MAADVSEIDRLDPEPVTVTLSTGFQVAVQRLKTRQFFRLLKVLTRGLGPALVQTGLDFNQDPDAFGQKLLAMTIMAIPEAEQQFIDFMTSMCTPLGLHESPGRKGLSKQQLEDNQGKIAEMLEELNNPELNDLLDLAEEIVKQEAPEIQALGKRVAGLLEMFRKTGQEKESMPPETPLEESRESSSPELSLAPSTSSVTSTDGPTSGSSASPSAGSGSASRRRQPAASVSS